MSNTWNDCVFFPFVALFFPFVALFFPFVALSLFAAAKESDLKTTNESTAGQQKSKGYTCETEWESGTEATVTLHNSTSFARICS